jgi:tetratricopeptide (TPR) repeat protein
MSLRSLGSLQISDTLVMPLVVPFLFAMLLAAQNVPVQNLTAQNHASLGISLAREGKLSEAEQELREAVVGAPAVGPYRAQLGSILGLQGQWKEALECFQKASRFQLVTSQADRTVALFHSIVQSGQRDKITKIVDVLKLRANHKL